MSVCLLLLITLVLPPYVAARCFGVPQTTEEPSEEGEWSLTIEVTSANGYSASATLGVDLEATEGYDREFDAIEPLFLFVPRGGETELTLYAYFYYPDNPETAVGIVIDPAVTVGLTTSVIDPQANMTWPLQVIYLLREDILINLGWDENRTRQLGGYLVELLTPFGEILPMAEVSSYSFFASTGAYDFAIRAISETEGPAPERLLIGGIITAYALAVAVILLLRRARISRR